MSEIPIPPFPKEVTEVIELWEGSGIMGAYSNDYSQYAFSFFSLEPLVLVHIAYDAPIEPQHWAAMARHAWRHVFETMEAAAR